MKSRRYAHWAVVLAMTATLLFLGAAGSIAFGAEYAPYLAGPVIHPMDLYAPYTYVDAYAPYVAGPVIHPMDLYAPYTYVDLYAPYVAGPVVHPSDLR